MSKAYDLEKWRAECKTYTPCSGQSYTGKSRRWGICLTDYEANPCWRYERGDGRIALFGSYETALKAAWELEKGIRNV